MVFCRKGQSCPFPCLNQFLLNTHFNNNYARMCSMFRVMRWYCITTCLIFNCGSYLFHLKGQHKGNFCIFHLKNISRHLTVTLSLRCCNVLMSRCLICNPSSLQWDVTWLTLYDREQSPFDPITKPISFLWKLFYVSQHVGELARNSTANISVCGPDIF